MNDLDISPRVRLAGATLDGWVFPQPDGTPVEIAIDAPGLGLHILPTEGSTVLTFTWRLPAQLRDGTLRIWNLATGQEIPGSPITIAPTPADHPPAASLLHWNLPLAGHIGTAAPTELAEGLWAAADPPARSLRYELAFPIPATATTPPPPALRLLSDIATARITLFFRLPDPETHTNLTITAWLPEATQRAMQAQAELWLCTQRDGAFQRLRRLRRARLFRRPALVTAALDLTEEERAAPTLWLALDALNAKGLAALAPALTTPDTPEANGMEDGRLATAFAALGEMVRVHGEAAMPAHPLLPALTTPPRTPARAEAPAHPFTQVILPVYNGADVIRDCLRSLQTGATGPFQVLVVDDGSRGLTATMLREHVAGDPRFLLHRRDLNRGYTKSINEAVALTRADWVVVLNSDTLVPKGWLDRLHAAAAAHPHTGMAGPLGNAATWQSVPEVKSADGGWSNNDIIEPHMLEDIQALIDRLSSREYPEFPILNGFCTLIARAVFDRVGAYDEEAFPMGYGEETDLCLRARRAGFRLTLADDAFVYHHKSISFGSAGRSPLTRAGGLEMSNKHLGVNINALQRMMQFCPPLARLRTRVADALRERPPA